MSETKFLPVNVSGLRHSNNKDAVQIGYENGACCFSSWAKEEDFKTAEDLKQIGADEYRQELVELYRSSKSEDIEEIFGTYYWHDLVNLPAGEFLAKIKDHKKNVPKAGEIWQRKVSNNKVVVQQVTDNLVVFAYADNSSVVSKWVAIGQFMDWFSRTGKTFDAFPMYLKELEGLNNA